MALENVSDRTFDQSLRFRLSPMLAGKMAAGINVPLLQNLCEEAEIYPPHSGDLALTFTDEVPPASRNAAGTNDSSKLYGVYNKDLIIGNDGSKAIRRNIVLYMLTIGRLSSANLALPHYIPASGDALSQNASAVLVHELFHYREDWRRTERELHPPTVTQSHNFGSSLMERLGLRRPLEADQMLHSRGEEPFVVQVTKDHFLRHPELKNLVTVKNKN